MAKNRWSEFFFSIVIGTLFAFALSQAMVSATALDIPSATLLYWCAVFVVSLNLILFNRYTVLAALAGLLVGGLILFISLWRSQFEAQWFVTLKAALDDLPSFLGGYLGGGGRPETTAAIVIPLLLSLLTVANTRIYLDFYALALLGAGLLSIPIYMDWGHSESAMFLFLFCLLTLLIKKLNQYASTKKDGSSQPFNTLICIPVALLVFGICLVLPKPDVQFNLAPNPDDLSGVVDNLMYELGASETFSFSDDGKRLGGPVSLDDQFVMEVEAAERVYLSGVIRDTYSGSSWTQQNKGSSTVPMDTEGWYGVAEGPVDLTNAQGYYMRYYSWSTGTATIYLGENRTKTVYTPPFHTRARLPEGMTLKQDDYGQLQTTSPLQEQASYTLEYISWPYDSSYFTNILQNIAPASGVAGLSDAERAPYLQLPDALPQRVKDLARELTDGIQDDYGKVEALRAYLSRYPYTLEPDEIPAGQDFVDYFLFEGQEGYCVYYASALAVLARCVDIPTRYVEGFVMPGEVSENGRYTVTSQQAHAWTEVYFPGFGWVRFEATASYSGDAPPLPDAQEESIPDRPESISDETSDESALDSSVPPSSSTSEEGDPETEADTPEKNGRWILSLMGGAAGLAVLAFTVYKIALNNYQENRKALIGLTNRDAVITYFTGIVYALGLMGHPMSKQETALAFARRVAGAAMESEKMERLAELFSSAAYSENNISAQDKDRMAQAYEEILVKLKASGLRRITYIINRYLLMRIP